MVVVGTTVSSGGEKLKSKSNVHMLLKAFLLFTVNCHAMQSQNELNSRYNFMQHVPLQYRCDKKKGHLH